MTIGKKIGGGFCIVILLTLALGLWAIHSMNKGAEVAETIANDRLPRLMHWSEAQNDLLEGTYFAHDYFSGGGQDGIKQAQEYLRQFGEGLKAVRQLNSKIRYETTAAALDRSEQQLGEYNMLLQEGEKLYVESEQYVERMVAVAGDTLQAFRNLIDIMSATLEDFINADNTGAARTYARNLAAANGIYAGIGAIYQDLLVAERNNDLSAFTAIQERLPGLQKDAQAVDARLMRDEGHAMFAEAMRKYQDFAQVATDVANTLRAFLESGKARYAQFEKMYDGTVKMVRLTTENSDKFSKNAAKELLDSTRAVAILLGAVVLLGVIVAFIITRLITRPLAKTQLFAQEVSGGNLDRNLDVITNDETGRLADALRSMVSSLKQNINAAQMKSEEAQKATEKATAAMARAEDAARQAQNAKRDGMLAAANQLEGMVEIISSASTELSAQIEQSDRGASESAQRLQEAATAMNEMNATVQEVARNAGSASEASSETRHKALAGQQVVREVVESMGNVHRTSLVLKEDMVQLNERAQDINRIMGVISDIADQTNLLALNAAIEAARAGEAGRGFAVVADEVRKLAEKTMTSTQDVSSAIKAIQESTSKSMRAVDEAVAGIGKATEFANQSGGALEEIVATVEGTSDQVQAIAAASEEQSAASEEINRSITEVNDMSRLTAEAMREAAIAVSDLANQAQKLTSLISEMKTA